MAEKLEEDLKTTDRMHRMTVILIYAILKKVNIALQQRRGVFTCEYTFTSLSFFSLAAWCMGFTALALSAYCKHPTRLVSDRVCYMSRLPACFCANFSQLWGCGEQPFISGKQTRPITSSGGWCGQRGHSSARNRLSISEDDRNVSSQWMTPVCSRPNSVCFSPSTIKLRCVYQHTGQRRICAYTLEFALVPKFKKSTFYYSSCGHCSTLEMSNVKAFLIVDLLAQMMAFSTSMGTVTNIAIRKVEAAVVAAAAVRVGGVKRKGKDSRSSGSRSTTEEKCTQHPLASVGESFLHSLVRFTFVGQAYLLASPKTALALLRRILSKARVKKHKCNSEKKEKRRGKEKHTSYLYFASSTDSLHEANLHRQELRANRAPKLPTVVSTTKLELSPIITCATGHLMKRD
ncbi:hypothetical protein D9C73_015391 [Collichthys lucidus]|uniref:Uncharacterized protein n=1 Tax=Collichthys lucidus TaxID=240159 RepID=A0A4U5V0V5_COLLU|nr:hypothetical protein D9C73_015391 [Collichthys lucidus]